jgi:hypothetical protein
MIRMQSICGLSISIREALPFGMLSGRLYGFEVYAVVREAVLVFAVGTKGYDENGI